MSKPDTRSKIQTRRNACASNGRSQPSLRSASACPTHRQRDRTEENKDVYRLQAAIAAEPVLRVLAGSVDHARSVALGQHLWLLPMTDAMFDAVTIAAAPGLDDFWKAPAGLERVLAACSVHGPVAYAEADYFGGVGTQCAQVWDAGTVVLGPLHLPEGEPFPADGSPISQSLRRLGTVKGDHIDEFDAVGLGRHRDTANWLPHAH